MVTDDINSGQQTSDGQLATKPSVETGQKSVAEFGTTDRCKIKDSIGDIKVGRQTDSNKADSRTQNTRNEFSPDDRHITGRIAGHCSTNPSVK